MRCAFHRQQSNLQHALRAAIVTSASDRMVTNVGDYHVLSRAHLSNRASLEREVAEPNPELFGRSELYNRRTRRSGAPMQTHSEWKGPFGDTVRLLMAEKGWNQSELARRAGIGRDNVSRYLNGKHVPTPIHLKRIADALHVSPGILYPGGMNQDGETEFIVELKLIRSDPSQALVRINQVMPTEIALQIVALAHQHQLPEQER